MVRPVLSPTLLCVVIDVHLRTRGGGPAKPTNDTRLSLISLLHPDLTMLNSPLQISKLYIHHMILIGDATSRVVWTCLGCHLPSVVLFRTGGPPPPRPKRQRTISKTLHVASHWPRRYQDCCTIPKLIALIVPFDFAPQLPQLIRHGTSRS